MARNSKDIFYGVDRVTVIIYILLVLMGWLNIYAVTYEPNQSIFDLSLNSGRQLLFISRSASAQFQNIRDHIGAFCIERKWR